MIKAIYRKRRNGNYDFLAAFSEDYDYDFGHHLRAGEEIIVKNFKDLEHLTGVIEAWEAKFEKKIAPTGCGYGIGG